MIRFFNFVYFRVLKTISWGKKQGLLFRQTLNRYCIVLSSALYGIFKNLFFYRKHKDYNNK